MDVESLYVMLVQNLTNDNRIESSQYKKVAGIPFIYITVSSPISINALEGIVEGYAKQIIKSKRITTQTIFVRQTKQMYVFRHRFFVPQEKMFCCGNECEDCIWKNQN